MGLFSGRQADVGKPELDAVSAFDDELSREAAERTERELSRQGLVTCRVPIDVDALVEWCRARNAPVNGPSRSEYVAEFMLRKENPS